MVVNLCQPPFQTTVQCNKLCADGFDISNLVSEDPAVRRRGFKLEYFLRPPVQVTLGFHWQVEVCGVDVELWPGGMDRTGTSRRLEVHSSSDANPDPTQGNFLQVGRCDMRDGVLVCFRAPRFRPRNPFPHPPPAPSAGATQSDLWNRGPQSLGSVARLRLSIPFSSAGSPVGFKALAVWGLPAHSCPPEALEEFQRAHRHTLAPLKPLLAPKPPAPTCPSELVTNSDDTIPDEFLDPLTQELMVLPMVLPSGAVVDLSSLEEYQRREATWGRSPNDPFTGVPFTADSKPLPCPLLKSRIDQMVLRRGGRPGTCGGKGGGATQGPQASRLIPQTPGLTQTPKQSQGPQLASHSSLTSPNCATANSAVACQASSSSNGAPSNHGQSEGEAEEETPVGRRESPVLRRKRRLDALTPDADGTRDHAEANSSLSARAESILQPSKKQRADQQTHSTGSHEERLSASLDAALSCALQGLPSFTSQRRPPGRTPHTGEDQCALCSVALGRYSASPAAYALPCRHFLCRPCLTRKAPPKAGGPQIICPTCHSAAPASAVTRVHH